MRAAAAARRVTLVMTTGFLAAGAAILIPACAARTPHDEVSPPAVRGATTAGPPPGTHPRAASPGPHPPSSGSGPDAALAAALAPVLRDHPGRLAVGVIDQATGVTATYHGSWHFDTASIIKADILAVLLLQHQQIGTTLSLGERQLATAMIEDSDNNTATALWNAVEGGPGMEAGNAALGLHGTWPDSNGAWGLTTTTVADQLRLLTDLTSARSPLNAASRDFELGLMRDVEPGQNWGVTAAAAARSRPAVKNGWLPTGPQGQWVINSIGVIRHAGQRLLIAVLSSGQPSEAAGISQVQAAARAAASAITDSRP
jgi:hypothetical protein